jgi:aryl-alcohol dehydrogenase-like predicted oxidoreductase
MNRRPLGARSGLEVSEIGLGLWAVSGSEWGVVQDQDNLEAIEAALESGVNFFDTADVYGGGHSEELLGRAMQTRRDAFVVATKIGWIDFDGQADRSQYDSVDKLVAGVEGSLRRLGTDRIDVIQCHVDYPEPNTPVFIEGFRRLKEAGTVRAWGVSTSDPDHLRRFNADGDCDVLQTDYSILNRTAEAELFPYCQEHGIGVIVRGPLAMGLLTGKYTASPPSRRVTSGGPGSTTRHSMSSSSATWRSWTSCATWSPTATRWPSSPCGSSAATQRSAP